jgi:hypothetical protein
MVNITPSAASPAPLGQMITWTATASDASGNLWCRFTARYLGLADGSTPVPSRAHAIPNSDYILYRDFAPVKSINWTASEQEGNYELAVTVQNNDTGESADAAVVFTFSPRATDSPVITATSNPLVYLYSAPACSTGNTMRVQFAATDGLQQSTNSKSCDGVTTMNFYLAGMRAQSQYAVQHIVEGDSNATPGPLLMQSTGDISLNFGPYSLVQSPVGQMDQPVLMHSRSGNPSATDLFGNILWYCIGDISFLSRPEPGGYFLGWYEDQKFDNSYQTLFEMDLAGMVTRQTNAARVSGQLVAMGMHPINAFHHEVRALPDGTILALAASERILTDVQGPGPVDVLGDTIVVLDPQLQVIWAWDTFDHLDPHRAALMGETCVQAANGCAPIYLAQKANDWTHGNSLALTPDGNILYSSRHQDWLIKIDYENGQGTGNILWRLGRDGDFQIVSGDPNPWFSHQHDANLDAGGLLTLFDNGNARYATDQTAHSRGQAIQLDEVNRTATLVLNADLGDYSVAVGSAQRLANGDFHFNLGFLTGPSARAVEVDPAGNIVYKLNIGELEYRSFRTSSLYQ